MGCKAVGTARRWNKDGSYREWDLVECPGYDPYNSADRYERITLASADRVEFDMGSESDANRALADIKRP